MTKVSIKSKKKPLTVEMTSDICPNYRFFGLEFQGLNSDNSSMGYTRQAVTGFGWQSIVTFLTAAVTAIKLALLARLLDQRDFGLFAYVSIALGLAESITQTGVNVTIIQAKESVKYFINTAWVIAITRGWVIGIVMVLLGLIMSQFYQEPSLTFLVVVAAFVPIIKGFINPSIILMQKELRFFRDSVYRFSLVLVEAVFSVILAWQLRSITALLLSLLIAALFEVAISFFFFKLKPRFEYLPSRAKQIFSNAKGLSVAAALSYISENIDDMILGRVLGTVPLGVYHTGYSLSHKPTYGLAQALAHSTLPVFAKISDDVHRLRRAFTRSMTGLVLLLGIVLIPMIFLPELVVQVILGEKWLAVVPILPWLGIAGAMQALTTICYNVLITQQRYKIMNFHRSLGIILFVPLFIWATSQYGLLGAAMAWAATRLITFPVILIGVMRRLR